MNNPPTTHKQHKDYGLIALTTALTLASCSRDNNIATECLQLQEAINANQASFAAGTINKAAETTKAQNEQKFATALTAVKLSNKALKEKRERLVDFSTQAHTLSLQAADIMTEDGTLTGNTATQYATISTQRIAINDQLFAEQNGLQNHCSTQLTSSPTPPTAKN